MAGWLQEGGGGCEGVRLGWGLDGEVGLFYKKSAAATY